LGGSSESLGANFKKLVGHCEPALLAALAILPILLLDCLRVTSKFAGPLVRLRNELRNLADGKHVEPLRLRKNDLCIELADEFNRLVERLQNPQYDTFRHAETQSDVSYEEPVAVS
jgi:signal transduction histidine kinase